MLLFEALILGIVQGLTEYIPISSSAHLIIIPWLFNWTDPAITSLSFDVALHLGTLLAVIWFFAADWLRLIRAGLASLWERKIGGDPDRKLAWLLILSFVPAMIAGALFAGKVDELFHPAGVPIRMSAMIVLGILIASLALALFIAERMASKSREMASISLKDALVIGLAQALAIFPGISRSGSTITAGLALGLKREDAARFSFLIGAPIIGGAGLKSAWELIQQAQAGAGLAAQNWLATGIGFVAAALSGYLCIRLLLRFLQKNSTDLFVYYRWGLAALVIVVALLRG